MLHTPIYLAMTMHCDTNLRHKLVCVTLKMAVGNYHAEVLKKSENVHDADFTARKLLTNSWDVYDVHNSSFKINNKSVICPFVDTPIS